MQEANRAAVTETEPDLSGLSGLAGCTGPAFS